MIITKHFSPIEINIEMFSKTDITLRIINSLKILLLIKIEEE